MLSFLWWSLQAAHMVWSRPHGWNWVPRQWVILTHSASLNMPHQDPSRDEIILERQAIVHAKDSLRMKSDRHLSLLERIIKSETEGDWWWGHHNLELIQDTFDIVPTQGHLNACILWLSIYLGNRVYLFQFCFHQNSQDCNSHVLECVLITWECLLEMPMPGRYPSLLTQRSPGNGSDAGGLSPSSDGHCLNGVPLIDRCRPCTTGKESLGFTPSGLPSRARAETKQREEVQRKHRIDKPQVLRSRSISKRLCVNQICELLFTFPLLKSQHVVSTFDFHVVVTLPP